MATQETLLCCYPLVNGCSVHVSGRLLRGEGEHLGSKFLPYTIEQIHGTLIGLDAVRDPATGFLIHERYHDVTGTVTPMIPALALDILSLSLMRSCRIRIGGCQPDSPVKFVSHGQHPYERMFSVQGPAFVIIGWPVATINHGVSDQPLDSIRRGMNKAGIMHRYHESSTDVDNDLYLVVGHHHGAAAGDIAAAVASVRTYLAGNPAEIDLGIDQVTVVAAHSPTLSSPRFTGKIPADTAEILKLFDL
jgi:hypothetical protein